MFLKCVNELWVSSSRMIVTNFFALPSFLARKSLDTQLQRMEALSSSESISMSDDINDIFKKCKLILTMKIYCQ